jgi:hypothetical protein
MRKKNDQSARFQSRALLKSVEGPSSFVKPKKRKPREEDDDDITAEKFFVSAYTGVDVLFGRGERGNQHPGNILYHKEKELLQPRYLQAEIRRDKRAIAQELVDRMRKHGSRFLALDPSSNQWHIVDNDHALAKAKQALRERFTPEERRAKRERYAVHKKPA